MGRRYRKNKELPILEQVEIVSFAAEGKSLARVEDKVVFVPLTVPGDIVDIQLTRSRSSFSEGKVIKYHKKSDLRIEPECQHFGKCGGCKWQMLDYKKQLELKQNQVLENFQHLGNFEFPTHFPILPSKNIYFYRNKLEFTFSNRKWLTEYSKEIDFNDLSMDGLGFHLPKMFDRILDLENCHLQKEPSNAIRMSIRNFAIENKISFYSIRKREGYLRNLIIRSASKGDLMVILVVGYDDKQILDAIMKHIAENFPEITSLMYIINTNLNDTTNGMTAELFKGNPFIMEQMEDIKFKVGPLSFYQTNSEQAYEMYKIAREYAQLTGEEVVYDLYTGTGTIANFIARNAKKVIGIEYVPEAIEDAIVNSEINKIDNTSFYAGDMGKVLTPKFVKENGKADVIITDPPRAGMHETVVNQLLEMEAKRIIYISCNPSTQARDIDLLKSKYTVTKVQPLDMFPQTHHVENIVLLDLI
ncbi:MAG: 23S rRNA (uracil(1939)-C(5))-methyltransferase RlmD [Bacteroidales bacterium]|jgi:23S rRNA (uracil1939-C5)-methyltransferase|nr:23S rRNA (uracil(1939)-C(5))-methyltransferase RlmD [Bacteroidales bacterium]